MEIRVLGDLTIDGGRLSPKERALLAALVLRAGNVVTPSELADAVWRDEPPSTWQKQVQAFVVHVRRALSSTSIATTPGGYQLRVDRDSIDAMHYERLIENAATHRTNGDPARAIDVLERAGSLWSGVPYADLGDWPAAIAEADRLEEIRKTADEDLQAARLECGEHRAVVADAERLVKADPLRERRWAILATALYRSGRQADALATLRSARERLVDELGIEPGAELIALEAAILKQDASLAAPPKPPATSEDCPYRGLQPFGVDDEEVFFGRDADIQAALARLAQSRFLAVSGASGSGKSSLVRAGLVPALQRRGDRILILTPEHDLDVRIREGVWSGRTDVVVVDQFEEVFHAGVADVDAVARAIAEAAVTGVTLILVVRSDFLDDCAGHPELAPLVAEGVHLVGPMAPAALREAVEEPARRAGLRLEPGLVELILRDAAGESGALPHLSHALVETWLRREGATLTVAGYEACGGISGAIAQSADRLYQSMDAGQRVTCRWLLLRLVALGPDGNPVRRRVASKPLRADAAREQVLSMLARSRLVSAQADSIEVAHESLATAWPRLQSWLEEDAEGTRILTAMAAAAEAWSAAGRPEDDLLRGARLQSAVEWRDAAPRDLTDVERAFLDASTARDTAEREQLKQRVQRDRRQNRRLRTLLGVATGLIVLLAGAGSVAVVSSQEANAQRDSATLEALVATSLALRTSERDVSALLAAEAYRRWPDDPRTRSGLMRVVQGADGFLGSAVVASSGNAYGSLVHGTDDVLVVTTVGDAGIRDAGTGDVLRELDLGFDPGPTSPRPLVEVSGDGRVGAVLWSAGTPSTRSDLVVFDLERGERIGGPTRIDLGTGALAVNADGSIVAVADINGGATVLVSTEDWRMRGIAGQTPVPGGPGWPTAALAFDNLGRLLVGRSDDRVEVIDPASATISASMTVPESSTHFAMAVGDSGIVIASGALGLIAFEPASQQVRWSTDISPVPEQCNWIAVSESMERVYCASRFGRISVFDLADGAPLPADEFGPLYEDIGTIDVSADGATLTVISGGEPVITRWRLEGIGLGGRLVAPDHLLAGPYSYEGSFVATAPQVVPPTGDEIGMINEGVLDGVVVVDTATGEVTYRFEDAVSDLGWARNGLQYARSDRDGVFHIIEADTGEEVGTTIDLGSARLWPSIDGTKLHAAWRDGFIQELDPRTGDLVGEPLQVEGSRRWHPLWVSVAPEGDRIAVTYSVDGASRETVDTSAIRLAMLSVRDHRILSDEPAEFETHVMLADGKLLGMEGTRMGRYETEPLTRVGSVPGAAGGLEQPSLSRDARTLLVTTDDGTALLYDTATGIRIGEPFRTDDRAVAPGIFVDPEATIELAFPMPEGVLRPDGLEIALSMPEGVVVWDIDPEHQFEFACRIAGRDLTDDEWRTYLAALGEPRSTCGLGAAD